MPILDFRLHIHDFVDAAHGDQGALEAVDDPAHVHDRADEQGQIGVEGDEVAHSHAAVDDGAPADPQVQAQAYRGDEEGEGAVDGTGADQVVVLFQVGLIERVERFVLGRRLDVGFDHADAGKVLLNEVAYLAEEFLDRLETAVHQGGHADDGEAEQRHGDQHDQGQLPVEVEHHGDAEE